jgi:hypothetical protein
MRQNLLVYYILMTHKLNFIKLIINLQIFQVKAIFAFLQMNFH